MSAAGLQAGAAVEDDHYILAQRSRLLLLSFAQTLSGGDHKHNRDNAPGNPKHREEGAQLVGPQGSQHIDKEIAYCHATGWTQPGNESNRLSAYSEVRNEGSFCCKKLLVGRAGLLIIRRTLSQWRTSESYAPASSRTPSKPVRIEIGDAPYGLE